MTHGTFETLDGRPAVRLERHLAHPIDAVWRAVTDPSELSHWFPATVEIDLRVGGEVRFSQESEETRGEVLDVDPPHRLAYTWNADELRFELEEQDGGAACRLVLTHLLDERAAAARNAAGWEVCLELLVRHVDGEHATGPGSEPTGEWEAHYEEYVRAGFPEGAPVPGRS